MRFPNVADAAGLPASGFMRTNAVLEFFGISRPTLYVWRKKHGFPTPVQLGPNTVGYPVGYIRAWLESRERAAS